MKIQKVRFKNFRNVANIEKELNGSNIILLGENTVGKSNFINGVIGALAGTVGKDAITHGADSAEVEVVTNEYSEEGEIVEGTDYTFKMKIKRDKEGEEKVTLEVTAPNGMRETKKTVIGSIAGEVELDYNFVELSKTSAGKKKQLEIIKSFLPEETLELLRTHENKVKKAYEDRTEVNRLIKTIEGFIQSTGLNPDDFGKYSTATDTASLLQSRDLITAKNSEIEGVRTRVSERHVDMDRAAEKIAVLTKELEQKKAELAEMKKKNEAATKWLSENKVQSTDSIDQLLSEANAHNIKAQQVSDMKVKRKELEAHKIDSGELTALYESTKQAISDAIKDMDFPIAGISFDEENVYYHGKMVDPSTMSTAETMMLEVELKALKGKGIVFIQRGESLGKNFLIELQAEASKRGYQIIMENVERGLEELKIELMPEYK